MCVALAGLGAAAGAAGAGGAAAGAGTGLVSTAMGYLMDYGPMALSIGSSLMNSNSATSEAEQKYNQLKWGIEARNIEKKGQALRNQDLYKQTAWRELNTATRAYFQYDVELNNQVRNANVKTQQNLIKFLGESSIGSAKGLGGTTADRLDSQALKNLGMNNTENVRKISDLALATKFNKESAQIKASEGIKIAGRKYLTSSMGEPIPKGPPPIDWRPGVGEAVAQTGLDLFSVISQPSPFNFPGNSGFDASKAFSGNQNVLGGLGFDQNIDLGIGSNQFTSMIGASPFSGLNGTNWLTFK